MSAKPADAKCQADAAEDDRAALLIDDPGTFDVQPRQRCHDFSSPVVTGYLERNPVPRPLSTRPGGRMP
ncbi:hypothetical protein MOQ72_15145 [Saccharopolyspora sp. K220]|uniref:hypothetical protein n=1 Tax=Saccharopolyspora soli TaxID=2926618 RepID=UPI001F5622CD|nr:hypothetical protein [Saccharopolyspora soli]MCI2418776.1 hypothetical protein [Saccharopolyspora soli]